MESSPKTRPTADLPAMHRFRVAQLRVRELEVLQTIERNLTDMFDRPILLVAWEPTEGEDTE